MSLTTIWFSRCGSADAFAHNCPVISLLSGVDQLTLTVPKFCAMSGIFNQATAIILFLCDHSPKNTGHFVGQSDGSQCSLFALKQTA